MQDQHVQKFHQVFKDSKKELIEFSRRMASPPEWDHIHRSGKFLFTPKTVDHDKNRLHLWNLCKNCNYTYIGETEWKFSTRLKEHKKEAERLTSKLKNFARQARKQSLGVQNKSAIAAYALQYNHVIDWDGSKVLQMESFRLRWVTLKKFVTHDGRNCQGSVKTNLGSAWKEIFFQHSVIKFIYHYRFHPFLVLGGF